MYIRVDTDGNPWKGTARYRKVPTPKEISVAIESQLPGLEINAIIHKYGGDVLATRRPDLISRSWIVKEA